MELIMKKYLLSLLCLSIITSASAEWNFQKNYSFDKEWFKKNVLTSTLFFTASNAAATFTRHFNRLSGYPAGFSFKINPIKSLAAGASLTAMLALKKNEVQK